MGLWARVRESPRMIRSPPAQGNAAVILPDRRAASIDIYKYDY
jgi:hypothetical protein